MEINMSEVQKYNILLAKWFMKNPLRSYDRGTCYTKLSKLIGIEALKLQKLVIGIEEPTMLEYLKLANYMKVDIITLKNSWLNWFGTMPVREERIS